MADSNQTRLVIGLASLAAVCVAYEFAGDASDELTPMDKLRAREPAPPVITDLARIPGWAEAVIDPPADEDY